MTVGLRHRNGKGVRVLGLEEEGRWVISWNGRVPPPPSPQLLQT
jgi:hypothetical protein